MVVTLPTPSASLSRSATPSCQRAVLRVRACLLRDQEGRRSVRFVTRVVVREDELEIKLDHDKLRQDLIEDVSDPEFTPTDPIRLSCPFQVKRRGSEVRLILGNEAPEASPIAPLGRVVARAHDWAGNIVTDELRTMADLVRYTGLTKPYIRQVLRSCVIRKPYLGHPQRAAFSRPDRDTAYARAFVRLARTAPLSGPQNRLTREKLPGIKGRTVNRRRCGAISGSLRKLSISSRLGKDRQYLLSCHCIPGVI